MDPAAWLRRSFEQLCWLAAIALPTFAALTRLASESVWADDMPVVRGLGLVSIGWPSTLSSIGMQLASLLPVGPLAFRLAFASALGLGACAALIQSLARRLLESHVSGSFINAPLAAIAALTATLGPALQREGTVAAGSCFGAAAALLALRFATTPSAPRSHRYALVAVTLGALVSESLPATALIGGCIVLAALLMRDAPRRGELAAAIGLLGASTLVFCLPALLRPSAPHVWLNIGRSLTVKGLVAIDTAAVPTTALAAWRAEVGTISVGLAALGAAIGVVRRRTRQATLPLMLTVVADVAMPATSGAVLTTDPLTHVRILALAAVAICAALGVQAAATTLMDLQLPMARAGAVLLIMFNLTLVAVASEQAAFAVDRSGYHGASVFTDEAIGKLDADAMVLGRSHALCWRLLCERLVAGARPDVVVVPQPLIGRGQLAAALMSAEPAIGLLLRDVAMDGTPGELAVSRLADRRALYVELDPAWNSKVASYLAPDGLWLRVHPQPQGASDRKLAIATSAKPFDRITLSVRVGDDKDRASAAVMVASMRQQGVAAAMVGDKKATRELLDRIALFDANDLFVRDMNQRLDHARGATIDVRGLLP